MLPSVYLASKGDKMRGNFGSNQDSNPYFVVPEIPQTTKQTFQKSIARVETLSCMTLSI